MGGGGGGGGSLHSCMATNGVYFSQWHLWRGFDIVGPVTRGQWPVPPDLPQVPWDTAVVVGLPVVQIGIHLISSLFVDTASANTLSTPATYLGCIKLASK